MRQHAFSAAAPVRMLTLLLALLGLGACGGEEGSPEDQVRQFIAAVEAAAEDRDLGALRGLVSEAYLDGEGSDKRAVVARLRLYLLRNQSIHIITRIEEIEFPTLDLATATVLAGMAGRRSDGEFSLNADLYEFRISLEDTGDGEWQLIRADWKRAVGAPN